MGGDFTVIAIVAARNEADIIAQVIEDLIRQRIQVYLIDDGSTDKTIQEASRWLGRGLLKIETRPQRDVFDWTGLLTRKQELAASLQGDWFIHHDADEFRESPWPHLDLHEAIRRVDELGYNAIDFRVCNFPPTHDHFVAGQDVRSEFRFFEPAAPWDTIQVKAWKRQDVPVDLCSRGGHDAMFEDRRVFPIQFLCRHYPIRGQEHGTRKVFTERQPRFAAEELVRGWHVQYRDLEAGRRFIRDATSLRAYDPDAIARELQVSHRDLFMRDEAEAATERLKASLAALITSTDEERRSLQEALTGLRHDLDRQAGELDGLRATIAVEREQARAQIEAARSALVSEQEAAGVRQRNLERQLSTDREAAAARMLAAETEASTERAAHERGVQGLRAELGAVYASKSWRLTRLLRALYSAITGRPKNRSDDSL